MSRHWLSSYNCRSGNVRRSRVTTAAVECNLTVHLNSIWAGTGSSSLCLAHLALRAIILSHGRLERTPRAHVDAHIGRGHLDDLGPDGLQSKALGRLVASRQRCRVIVTHR